MMVLSKSFSVLRSAVTPRVMPPTIDLVRVNSRLTMFGLIGGTIVGGGIAAGAEYLLTTVFKLPGALFVVVFVAVAGASLSMRIPRWVEVTEGEVPATLTYHGESGPQGWVDEPAAKTGRPRQPLGRNIITSLWGQLHDQGDGRIPVPVSGVRRQGAPGQRLGTAGHAGPARRRRRDRQLRG